MVLTQKIGNKKTGRPLSRPRKEKVMDIDKWKLTKEVRQEIETTGKCPHCDKAMMHINPPSFPKKQDLYCEPCHYTYPLGNYRDR